MITYSFVFMLYHFSPWSFVRYPLTSIFRSWFGNRHLVMIYLSLSFVKVVANIDWNKACVEARSVPYIQPCSISCFFQILIARYHQENTRKMSKSTTSTVNSIFIVYIASYSPTSSRYNSTLKLFWAWPIIPLEVYSSEDKKRARPSHYIYTHNTINYCSVPTISLHFFLSDVVMLTSVCNVYSVIGRFCVVEKDAADIVDVESSYFHFAAALFRDANMLLFLPGCSWPGFFFFWNQPRCLWGFPVP